ncbi:hypothetical protein [Clostridium sp. UBA6640]|uniref:hypothetical protein n=1 Tax=Clostridium sp. UBA6640 TaxID=1946370 RepID=UPI0025C3EFF6|nr:hypothetical protein [Clostridium sp. UBA6640]
MSNLDNYFNISFDQQFLLITSIISIVLGAFLIIFGLLRKKKTQGKSTLAWTCIGIGVASILSNIIQILSRI